jgi:hypothetical protein
MEIDPGAGRSETPIAERDQAVIRRGLTSLRRTMASQVRGRILLGGKKAGYQGDMPGVLEEAILALEQRQPLYLAGGFGGVTLDIIGALDVDDITWLPPAADVAPDSGLVAGLSALKTLAQNGNGAVDNGLRPDENERLARTYRPSEIATLIGLGLGRLSGAAHA